MEFYIANRVYLSNNWVRVMVFNTTFSNISDRSLRSVLLVKKPEYPEKTIGLSKGTDKLYHINVYRVHFATSGIRTHNLVIGTDCKFNYHTITTIYDVLSLNSSRFSEYLHLIYPYELEIKDKSLLFTLV